MEFVKETLGLTKKTKGDAELTEHGESLRPQIYSGYGEYADAKSGTHLRDYWRSIRKYQWMIISLAVVAAAAAAIYMARQPDIYEAHARVQVDLESTSPALAASKDSPAIVANTVNDPTYFSTQLQVLSSSGLLRRVVKTLDLAHDPAFLQPQKASSWGETWKRLRRMFGLGGEKDAQAGQREQATAKNSKQVAEIPLTSEADITTTSTNTEVRPEDMEEVKQLAPYVDIVQRNLVIEPVKDSRLQVKETRLIDVRYSHPNPEMTARVVNALINSFASSNLERQAIANGTAGEFLQKRIAELQAQIRDKEEQLSAYGKNHQITSLDASQNTVAERLAGLNRQLLEAENDRKIAEAAYLAAKKPGAADALAEGNSQQIAATEIKLADLKQKREQMLVEATEEWVEVKEVNKQIAELERQIKDERQRAMSVVLTNLETRYNQSLEREKSISDAFDRQRAEVLTQNDAAINYRIIQQEIETNRNLLDGLLQRSKENNVLLAALVGTPNNIRVTDYALVPASPVGPKRLQSVAVAFLGGLGLGIAIALFLMYMDNSINSPDDVEKMLRLPALAMIPSVGSLVRKRYLRLPVKGLLAKHNDPENGHQRPLLMNEDEEARSYFAEAYKQLRTSVLMSTAGHAPKTLLVTSGSQSEGKTTTAVNTAFVLAQTGASVLMIDADMRKPSLHTIFNLPRGEGLSTILSNEMSEAEMLGVIKLHEESNLHVLPAGPMPPNPAELLGSEQMRSLINACEMNFTHIVIDSPPVTMFTDGVLISSQVDGVLLVVNCGKSSREMVKLSRKVLMDVGAKIFGVVLNNAKVRLDRYDY